DQRRVTPRLQRKESASLLTPWPAFELLADNVLRILIILLADVFDQLRVRLIHRRLDDGPRTRVGLRIVDRDRDVHVAEVLARVAFGHVQRIGDGMTVRVEPALVVETLRLHDECVALPLADRVALPRGLHVLRERTAVRKDLPEDG